VRIRVGATGGDIVGATGKALQIAADALRANGGGVLEIGPGTYLMEDSLRLGSGTRVVGAGRRTVLKKCPGPASPLLVDADYGQLKITPKKPGLFRVGMGVSVGDEQRGGWFTTTSRITAIEGGVLHIADHLVADCRTELTAWVRNAVSVISGVDCEDVVIEGLVVNGSKRSNAPLNGCRGGGIYFHRAKRCRVADCLVRDFAGDGISFQITQEVTVERCTVTGCANFGLHPGTGSARPRILRSRFSKNGSDGVFVCWRVQDGLFEGCEIASNGRHGVSIGHKDTGNLFRKNTVRGNGEAGVYFRDEKRTNAPDRNRFEENLIESNGRRLASPAVVVNGSPRGLVFERNVIRPGKAGRKAGGQRSAFCLGSRAKAPRLRANRIGRHPLGRIERA
jgi:hypothetical protein